MAGPLDPRLVPYLGTTNEQLMHRALRRGIFLEGVKTQEVDAAIGFLNDKLIPDVAEQLKRRLLRAQEKGFDPGPETTARLKEIAASASEQVRQGLQLLSGNTTDALLAIAKSESESGAVALSRILPFEYDTKVPSLNLLRAAVRDRPFHGQPLVKWFDKIGEDATRSIQGHLQLGFSLGESVEQIVKRVEGDQQAAAAFQGLSTAAQMRRGVRAVVRTGVTHATSEASIESLRANADVVKAYQLVATLDIRTTPICRDVHGKVFPLDEGPHPPLHWNCRTRIVAVVKSMKEMLEEGGVTTEQAAEIPKDEIEKVDGAAAEPPSYSELLEGQPPEVQDMALGSTELGDAFRSGSLEGRSLAPPAGSPLSVAQADELEEALSEPVPISQMGIVEKEAYGTHLVAELNDAPTPAARRKIEAKLRYLDPQWKLKYDKTPDLAPVLAPPTPVAGFIPSTAAETKYGQPESKLEKIRGWLQQLKNPTTPEWKKKSLRSSLWKTDKQWKAKFDNPEFIGAKLGAPSVAPDLPVLPVPDPPAGIPKAALEPQTDKQLIVADLLEKGDPSPGSNPGAFYTDKVDGTKWLVKQVDSERARDEILASKLYQLTGVRTVDNRMATVGGKTGVASKFVHGLKKADAQALKQAQSDFAVDAWLANWDVVGLESDNLLMDAAGNPIRVDTGGALRYRAQGKLKGSLFGTTVGEINTLRDPNVNAAAAKVFGSMTDQEVVASIFRVESIDVDKLLKLVQEFGPENQVERDALAIKLLDRRQSLLKYKKTLLQKLAKTGYADTSFLPKELAGVELEDVVWGKTDTAGAVPWTVKGFDPIKKQILVQNPQMDSPVGLDAAHFTKTAPKTAPPPVPKPSKVPKAPKKATTKKESGLPGLPPHLKGSVAGDPVFLSVDEGQKYPYKLVGVDSVTGEVIVNTGVGNIGFKPSDVVLKHGGLEPAVQALSVSDRFNLPVGAADSSEWKKWYGAISEKERGAFRRWIGSGYVQIRQFQWKGIENPEAVASLRTMNAAMDRAPRFVGKTYRGVSGVKPQDFTPYSRVGNVIELDAHQSQSTLRDTAESFGSIGGASSSGHKILFEIETKTGVDLGVMNYAEQEVMLRAGTRLKVTEVELLEEAQTAKQFSTYRIKLRELEPGEAGFATPFEESIAGQQTADVFAAVQKLPELSGKVPKVQVRPPIAREIARPLERLNSIFPERAKTLKPMSVVQEMDLADPIRYEKDVLSFAEPALFDDGSVRTALLHEKKAGTIAEGSIEALMDFKVGLHIAEDVPDVARRAYAFAVSEPPSAGQVSARAAVGGRFAFAEAYAATMNRTAPEIAANPWLARFARFLGEDIQKSGRPLPSNLAELLVSR